MLKSFAYSSSPYVSVFRARTRAVRAAHHVVPAQRLCDRRQNHAHEHASPGNPVVGQDVRDLRFFLFIRLDGCEKAQSLDYSEGSFFGRDAPSNPRGAMAVNETAAAFATNWRRDIGEGIAHLGLAEDGFAFQYTVYRFLKSL